jgi:hypothetical protein
MEMDAKIEDTIRTEYLSINEISCLLDVANEELGTNFQVGYIAQGYRVNWDFDSNEYDYSFVQETTALIPQAVGMKNGPMLVSFHSRLSFSSELWLQKIMIDDLYSQRKTKLAWRYL